MQITLDILKAQIFRPRYGPDSVTLTPRIQPANEDEPFDLSFKTPKGKAEEYLETFFPGVPVELIEQPAHEYKFTK